ncbi:hypothetical protein LP420_14590 [Massilia sp. B-10]|nr:hypothetical protein LP420_14590 [Massilia sp. B-10]
MALREVSLDDPTVTCTVALFNLAATPEKKIMACSSTTWCAIHGTA